MEIMLDRDTRARLDAEFSPSRLAPNFLAILEESAERSVKAKELTRVETYSYGSHPTELLDHFPAPEPGAPLQVFIHGGHWQQSGKDEASFSALDFVNRGYGFIAVGYGLAPDRTLPEMTDAVWRALCWIRDHAEELGTRPDAVHASGSSAGAHLLAMALCTDRRAPGARPPLAGACLLSGTYDLEPVRHTYVNDALGLDAATARSHSPLHALPCRTPRLLLARGEFETDEYIRQHGQLLTAARRAGNEVAELVVPGTNHFDVVFGLGDPASPLGARVLATMATSPLRA
ncbi:alpha/beta hydrolase fold domain-containing protein [Nocardia terpenica]|uniref:Alpha/beta hydrolase fold domain-containing protein n=2 Tax=Nocardia terpenica TaxID=455432 RepID=A0A6G9YYC9_9NOCA|nr:alpha/beta hydrolase fold domain-containing protein [Nocardia terpenica]